MALDPIPMLAKALTHPEERGAVRASQVAGPADADAPSTEPVEEAEVLQASIRAGSVAQIVVAFIAVLGLIYVLKLVLITTLTSLLLAFLLEPLAGSLGRIGLPRWAGSLLSVLLMVALALCLTSPKRASFVVPRRCMKINVQSFTRPCVQRADGKLVCDGVVVTATCIEASH